MIDQNDFNIADYSKKIFNMFSGETEEVELQFDNSLINVVIDRFGKDVVIHKNSNGTFRIIVDVVPSDTFLGWLFMFGDNVKILSPVRVIDKFKEMLKKVSNCY